MYFLNGTELIKNWIYYDFHTRNILVFSFISEFYQWRNNNIAQPV